MAVRYRIFAFCLFAFSLFFLPLRASSRAFAHIARVDARRVPRDGTPAVARCLELLAALLVSAKVSCAAVPSTPAADAVAAELAVAPAVVAPAVVVPVAADLLLVVAARSSA